MIWKAQALLGGLLLVQSVRAEYYKYELARRDVAIEALKEMTIFLAERADDSVVEELNERMNYWRAVLGIPTV